MLNNLVTLSENLGIWDLRGQKIWDLGFEGSKIQGFGIWGVKNLGIWDLRGQKFRDLGFEGSKI